MKPYAVTMRNPINGYTWTYYSPEVASPDAAMRLAEFHGMGAKAIKATPIE